MSSQHASKTSFAYVVQLDLPGAPIKVGCTTVPSRRMAAFRHGTPCDIRMVGATLDGHNRERQLLEALRPNRIHGEWGTPNDAVAALIRDWYLAGEWFVASADIKESFERLKIADRVRACGAPVHYTVSRGTAHYHWANAVRKAAEKTDPMLGLHWDGMELATVAPTLVWPSRLGIAA